LKARANCRLGQKQGYFYGFDFFNDNVIHFFKQVVNDEFLKSLFNMPQRNAFLFGICTFIKA